MQFNVAGGQNSGDTLRTFVDEALLMRTFRHDHVLTMLGISFDIYGQPLVILPYLGKGDLRSYLQNPSNVSGIPYSNNPNELLKF